MIKKLTKEQIKKIIKEEINNDSAPIFFRVKNAVDILEPKLKIFNDLLKSYGREAKQNGWSIEKTLYIAKSQLKNFKEFQKLMTHNFVVIENKIKEGYFFDEAP